MRVFFCTNLLTARPGQRRHWHCVCLREGLAWKAVQLGRRTVGLRGGAHTAHAGLDPTPRPSAGLLAMARVCERVVVGGRGWSRGRRAVHRGRACLCALHRKPGRRRVGAVG